MKRASYGREFLARSVRDGLRNSLLDSIARKQWQTIIAATNAIPSRIIEVGPGVGRLARQIQKAGLSTYIGYESDPEILLFLKGHSQGKFIRGSLPHIRPRQRGDLVLASHVLEHARDYEHARKWLQNLKQMINEKGRLCIIVPDCDYWGSMFWNDHTHGFPTNQARLEGLLLSLEMEVVSVKRLFGGSPVKTKVLRGLMNFVLEMVEFVIPSKRQFINGFRQAYLVPHLLVLAVVTT